MNIIEFNHDIIGGQLSPHQETALRLTYGLSLNDHQREIAKQALGIEEILDRDYGEISLICGRRSGKTERIGSTVAVFEATMGGHEQYLTRGERAHIVLVHQDMRAARVSFRYILGKLEGSDHLANFIDAVRTDEIDLTNRVTISIMPCSFRAVRGFAVPVAILDEVAFYRVEGVNVDKDVIDSIRPAMAQFPNAKLIKVSSPYSKQGELYRDFATRHQREDLLCFRAESWLMNPSLRQSFLDSERARDPELFDREFGALFTDQLSNAFSRESVERCVFHDRRELPPVRLEEYTAGVDPSGGGPDEFTLSICHRRAGKIVQDCVRAYRSGRPADVVEEMMGTLRTYGIRTVHGDRYSGEWVRQEFAKYSIEYRVADLTASEAFLELLPVVNQGNVELLDDRVQTAQLVALERRRGQSGKDSLGHPRGGHDDRANALALAAYYTSAGKGVECYGIF